MSWLGQVTTQDNLQYRITNTKSDGNQADYIHIFVTYDITTGIPQVLQIRLHQQEICDINYNQFTNLFPASALGGQNYAQQLAQCGIVKIDKDLSPHVVETLEGQWPWQAVIYKNQGGKIQHTCGGTLVSRRHVITVAHCLTVKKTVPTTTLDVKIFMVFVGAYNLAASLDGVQIKLVERLIIYPEYQSNILRNDLGILQFREPAQYSNWVQPVCLWPEPISDLDKIVGKNGTVAGWNFFSSDNLRLSQLTIVSQTDCLRSDPNFSRLTSKYTLCGEIRKVNRTIACLGSSGNGLMLRINGAWHLRAMISLGLRSQDNQESRCAPGHKIVLTDVAQYLPWIKENITPY